jgi:DNA polymerase I-like protein with 3'-5' exonuclease and polymerase domains
MKAEVLEEFFLEKYPWVKNLLTFKKLRKLHSGYILPAINLNIDGWLYMDMKQNGTVSGRFACSGGFNLQTLPRVDDEMEMLETCKCGSSNVEISHPIETAAIRKCLDCGHIEEDIPTPSAIKKGFISPPGYKIVNADYSSLEPRCFAYVSGDDKLKEVYWNNLDLYSKVYCDMFDENNEFSPDPKDANFLKKVAKAKRSEVKPIVLGIPYGSGAFQVATMCNKYKEILDKKTGEMKKIPDEEYGQWVIDKYLGTYGSLYKYMEQMELDCLKKGYVESLFGRRRHFQYAPVVYKFLREKGLTHRDLIDCKHLVLKKAEISVASNLGNKMNFTKDELKALIKDMGLDYVKCAEKGFWAYVRSIFKNDVNNSKNFPIQSLAGHITNKGMLDTTRKFKELGLDAWVFLQVHDEISCYVAEDTAEQGSEILKNGMENNVFAKALDVAMIARD